MNPHPEGRRPNRSNRLVQLVGHGDDPIARDRWPDQVRDRLERHAGCEQSLDDQIVEVPRGALPVLMDQDSGPGFLEFADVLLRVVGGL